MLNTLTRRDAGQQYCHTSACPYQYYIVGKGIFRLALILMPIVYELVGLVTPLDSNKGIYTREPSRKIVQSFDVPP